MCNLESSLVVSCICVERSWYTTILAVFVVVVTIDLTVQLTVIRGSEKSSRLRQGQGRNGLAMLTDDSGETSKCTTAMLTPHVPFMYFSVLYIPKLQPIAVSNTWLAKIQSFTQSDTDLAATSYPELKSLYRLSPPPSSWVCRKKICSVDG